MGKCGKQEVPNGWLLFFSTKNEARLSNESFDMV